MSPVRLRLLLRDLASGAAFGSMAISGQLPVWTLALYFLALAVALLGLRPFASSPRLTAALLVPVAATLYLLVAAGQLDLVLAACSFAGLISAQRLLSAPGPGSDGQVLLIALLMIAGGAALSADLLFSLFLVAFTATASLSMGLGVVQASAESEPVPPRRVLSPLSLGLVFAVAGAVAFFFLFPRLSWNVGARRPGASVGVATTGFSDTVQLGGTGVLKSNPRTVLRASLTPDPRAERLESYWVGRTYDAFNGREWTSTTSPMRRALRLNPELRQPGRWRDQVTQRVELLPAYGSRTLILLEQPLYVGNSTALSPAGQQPALAQEATGEELRFAQPAASYLYSAYSRRPDSPRPVPLELEPQERAQLLSLPPGLDPRVAALARQVVGGTQDPLEAARRLAEYLQREYAYTLELAEAEDPLVDFLFVRKAGHCEHFASALTLMLRTQGFPSRLATGFFGGERVGEGTYIVRAGDAHAWTHVLVPGRGFVTVDATPSSNRSSQASPLLERLLALYEAAEERWRSSVIDYTFRDQFNFVRELVRPPRQRPQEEERRSSLPPARAWGVALLVGAAAYAAWLLLARRLPAQRPVEATRFIEVAERRLASAGLHPREGESVEELSTRLASQGHPVASSLAPLTRRYLEARFGNRPLRPGEARHLLRTLERSLEQLRRPGSPPPSP